ncbi:MAG: hypothetical protein IJY10_01790 [Lachnospiraceae bacterium]|nr:hypothetical protein [Lachnospiraceae bacterium]
MNSRTKIVVLRLKELIHLGVFVALCLILILLLWVAFRPKETNSPIPSGTDTNTENGEEMNSLSNTAGIYIPGVYSTALVLGNQTVDMEIVVDHDVITAVRLVNLDEAVATMYPLLEPALEAISSQLYDGIPLDQVSYGEENKYTSQILLNAIQESLSKATPTGE